MHAYRIARDGPKRSSRAATWTRLDRRRGREGGRLYFLASPDNATQGYLYRARLDGRGAGTRDAAVLCRPNLYSVSPDGRFAVHAFSRSSTRGFARSSPCPTTKWSGRGRHRGGESEGPRPRCHHRPLHRGRRRRHQRGWLPDRAAGLRSDEAISGPRARLRRAGVADGDGQLGRQRRPFPPLSRQPRIPRRQLRQCRNAGPARPRVEEGRLRRGRRAVLEAAGGGAAIVRAREDRTSISIAWPCGDGAAAGRTRST